MLNKVMLIGNLGTDPEVRQTSGGTSVAELRIATSEKFTSADGKVQERTEWHRVVVWGKTADNAGQYLKKGSKVYAEGRIQTREYQDKEGNKRYVTEIIASTLKFLDPRKSGGTSDRQEPSTFSDSDIPY